MSGTQIGAQLYTLRDHLQTPDQMAHTFDRVKGMGYDAVQCSALGQITSEALAKLLRNTRLQCAATHVSMDQLADTQACLDHHAAINCNFTAIGGAGQHPDWSATDWIDFAKRFGAVVEPLHSAGLRVGYHNHSHEFARHDGCRPLDLLLEHFPPSVWLELDTYWVAHAGGDPVAWINRIAATGSDRIPCIHVKDLAVTAESEQFMTEVGTGNLNWPGILEACRGVSTQWYLVERDNGPLDPFESLRISLENMKAMGLK